MKLTAYITRELIPPLLAGTLLFVAILSFGYFFISSQFLGGVPAGLIAKWIGYQLPDTLVIQSKQPDQNSNPLDLQSVRS